MGSTPGQSYLLAVAYCVQLGVVEVRVGWGRASIIVLVALQIGSGSSLANDAAIRAPVGCNRAIVAASCGYDFSSEEARRNDTKGLDLPPAIFANFCQSPQPVGFYYGWARVADAKGGLDQLAILLQRAASAAVVKGYQIVEALPIKHEEKRFALCEVSAEYGPPRDCVTVAIIAKQETWLRVGKEPSSCFLRAFARNSGSIGIQYTVQTKTNPTQFANAVRDMLKARQDIMAQLAVFGNPPSSVRLMSTAPLRDSKTLQRGWRETYDFEVYFGRRGSADTELSIEGTLVPLVNRLATGSLTEYQGLTDAQRSLYMTTFDRLVLDAVKMTCSNYRQLDAERIDCND